MIISVVAVIFAFHYVVRIYFCRAKSKNIKKFSGHNTAVDLIADLWMSKTSVGLPKEKFWIINL